MIGLALEGGGVRGSYQAGVYKAMLECGIKIDGVAGTSIGAINASIIASGKGEDLPKIWGAINVGDVFGFSKNVVDFINKREVNINNFVRLLKESFDIILNKGIELKGVRNILDTYLDVDSLINSDIDFGLVTIRVKDLKPLYLFKKDMDKEHIKDYIIASSFLPIFKREKLIDNGYYLDGGFYDLGPVNMLLEKGYKKVYLVKVHGIGRVRPYDDKADVVVIEPKRSLGNVIELDPIQVLENINMGYYDAIRVIKKLDGYKYVFKVKKEKFYKFINRKVSKREYKRVKNFFKTKNYKETTLKALEYIMESESINYYKIYKPYEVIKKIKRKYKKKNFIYIYINKLKYFI